MSRRDVRPLIFRQALTNPDLTPGQRLFLVTVVALSGEYVDGRPRTGSKGMDARGHFAHHYDYLGRALHTSAENAKKQAERMARMGYLSKVHPGTYGRPATWHALLVRRDMKYRVTFRPLCPSLQNPPPTTRGDTVSPLTYKTPDRRNPSPADGVPPTTRTEVEAPRSEAPDPRPPSSADWCEFHQYERCPEDCKNAPATEDRRTEA